MEGLKEIETGRIYVVKNMESEDVRLVRAKSQAAALAHVLIGKYDVYAASATSVAELMENGVVVERCLNKNEATSG